MTQRFGRNQRRRAREALAAKTAEAERLMAANTMNLALLRDVSKKALGGILREHKIIWRNSR